MRNAPRTSRRISLPSVLGLVTASVAFLCGGAVLATEHEGLLRLLFAIAGFSGYLFFLAHALKELGLPSTISGDAPDGEVRRKPALRTARKTAGRDRDFTLAA